MRLRYVQWYVLREALQTRASRFWCRLFGHFDKRVQKMWCSLCARCSAVVEEKPRQAALPALRLRAGSTSTFAIPSETVPLTTRRGLDEMLAKMSELVHQHRDHPERTRAVAAEMWRLAALRAELMPLHPLCVERSDFLAPDEWVSIDGRNVLGRCAWYRLMRTVHAPWPEEALTPDQDYPRDSAP